MGEEPRSIFRKEALESWMNREETENLPGSISPRLFVFLWIIFGLLVTLGIWVSCAEVKTYTFGQGFIVSFENAGSEEHKKNLRVVSFFPEDMGPSLSEGARLWVRFKDERQWHGQTIVAVEPKVLGPAEVMERFGLAVTRPVRAVISRSDDKAIPQSFRDIPGYKGPLEVRVQAGFRKVASFLPIAGDFFEKE